MKALLVRVGADQSESGGFWNGLVDSQTDEFVYVPIPESGATYPHLEKPYSLVASAIERFGLSLPFQLAGNKMHLDPDFSHLSYGDQGQRAMQISKKLTENDLMVFYAGLRDVHPQPRLVYALIGLYVVELRKEFIALKKQLWRRYSRKVLGLPSDSDQNRICNKESPGCIVK